MSLYGVRFFPAGDGWEAVMDRAADWILGAQVVEVRVWVGNQRRVGEVVNGVVIGGDVKRFLPKPVDAAMA